MNPYKHGKYLRVHQLGEGAYGNVYLAQHESTQNLVAIKTIKMDRLDEGISSTTLREMAILKSCSHPNIIKYYLRLMKAAVRESVDL